MLLLCITGLPLIFHHEIGHLLGTEVEAPEMRARRPAARRLDRRARRSAKARHPERVVQFVSQEEDDDRLWFVTLTPTPDPTDDFRSVAVDARTGVVLAEPRFDEGFMWVMFKLHVDLFAGLPGKLFLGFMGLLLLVAIVSGVVLYAPFMRKLDFGDVRRDRSPRIKWLDLHNLLGIVTLVWALVVGATGMINTWADLLIKYWQFDQLSTLLAPYRDEPTLADADRGSVQQFARDGAGSARRARSWRSSPFRARRSRSPHHYTFFMRGNTPLTVAPAAAGAGRRARPRRSPPRRELPWYLTALLVSQPLHFGDYGGMPMKIVWALLDIVTIVVLGSGLYLWLRRKAAAVVGGRGRRRADTVARSDRRRGGT